MIFQINFKSLVSIILMNEEGVSNTWAYQDKPSALLHTTKKISQEFSFFSIDWMTGMKFNLFLTSIFLDILIDYANIWQFFLREYCILL